MAVRVQDISAVSSSSEVARLSRASRRRRPGGAAPRQRGAEEAIMRRSNVLDIQRHNRRSRLHDNRLGLVNHPDCQQSGSMRAAEGRGGENGADGGRQSRLCMGLSPCVPDRPGLQRCSFWTPPSFKKQASKTARTARRRCSSFGRTPRTHSTVGSDGAYGEQSGESRSRSHRD